MNLYNKPPIKYSSQLKLLQDRGLIIADYDKALHLLDKIGYFRLSGYFYPQLSIPKEDHKFKQNSYFDSSFKMYCFDRELRILVLSNIEKIEVAFRSKLTYVMSMRYDAFWYSYGKLFKDPTIYANGLGSINKSKIDSQEDFVIKYNKKYLDNCMPSWMVMEIVTLAHLSKTYSNIKDTQAKSIISNDFGVPYQLLESWLLILTYCRNICAHHSRFWNRELALKPLKATNTLPFKWIDQNDVARNKSYMYLSILKYLLDRVNPNNCFKANISKLFEKYPNIDYLKSMGFPDDWERQPLWENSVTHCIGC